MANRPLSYRKFLELAKKFGVVELPKKKRGKGSERLWERTVNGRRLLTTVTCHKGKDVRRRLELSPDHGVSDDDFYGSH